MVVRFFIILIFSSSLLTANAQINSKKEINTQSQLSDDNELPTAIQDKVLNTSSTPYTTLDKIFPNYYLEGVMNGFIDTIENVLLKIDIRRISLDFSNTSINVTQEYIDDNINQFNSDSSTIVGFNADLALDYNFTNSRFSNRLLMEYGLILLRPRNAPRTKTETSDNIVFTIGYTRKSFMLKNGFVGPFVDGEYQTEFTRNSNGTKNQALRYKAGIRMLDGKYIDELYLAGVGEIDFSLKPSSIRGAIETGIRAKNPITDNIGVVYQAFWRQYIGYTNFRSSDLEYNANFGVRLDVSIYEGFALSPFVSARFAKIKGSTKHASNITTGVALLFSSSINAISNIKSTQDENLKSYFKSID
ncbi:hypothetical protein [Helicobacter sp. MIT 14-3879]|uniref:hypothetical protein n=1 Tax=Helicobacter sp. MIT 14-3879 TaxID=2040649 RepID=UPI000E1E47D2|nr:hypothetical protein [Helicobacter sp. MIT 14-3879]RDU65651.1 hypothetical protein CQA44_01330 [Helicobacter sp. MIT 14-3879]